MSLFLPVAHYSAAFIKDPFNDPQKMPQSSITFSVDFPLIEHTVFHENFVKNYN